MYGDKFIRISSDKFASDLKVKIFSDEPYLVRVYAVSYEHEALDLLLFEYHITNDQNLNDILDLIYTGVTDAALPLHLIATGSEVF